ncbi:hypothetical protein BN946_scf184403.g9 [Trametes cinnabarina]|uniref:F-box domain-containing protein n=1 Tax=Pycnoporus cinnabarinus TaxID=5643 RepID=A0A060SXQ3_PYCCI|nr:hypothetical protein BN946_scf184403.g9 [Trametes cinnabarina]
MAKSVDDLPVEVRLPIMTCLPLSNLRILRLTSRHWNDLFLPNESAIYHNASLTEGFVESQSRYPLRGWFKTSDTSTALSCSSVILPTGTRGVSGIADYTASSSHSEWPARLPKPRLSDLPGRIDIRESLHHPSTDLRTVSVKDVWRAVRRRDRHLTEHFQENESSEVRELVSLLDDEDSAPFPANQAATRGLVSFPIDAYIVNRQSRTRSESSFGLLVDSVTIAACNG